MELTIVRRVQDRIRRDSVARIETLGLLGDKIIEVSLGSLESDGARRGRRAPDRGAVRHQPRDAPGDGAAPNLVEVSAELKVGIAKITESAAGPDLAETVRSVRALASEIEKGQGLCTS